MFKVIDSVDTGKTKKLLEECIRTNGVFVCKHPERVPDKCLSYGLDSIPIYMGYEEFLNKLGKQKFKRVYIDELEKFNLVLFDLEGYTITKED